MLIKVLYVIIIALVIAEVSVIAELINYVKRHNNEELGEHEKAILLRIGILIILSVSVGIIGIVVQCIT